MRRTASGMCSLALHPGLYRMDSVRDGAFAEVIGMSEHVADFLNGFGWPYRISMSNDTGTA
jgi:hypothetical protein